ncbi:MAG TPA: outer membrane protein transport protein [Candidatus Kapabacteria bacterium]|nr:outer membrane protein transport protein [Candidatus Kapabacteria bacterium]
MQPKFNNKRFIPGLWVLFLILMSISGLPGHSQDKSLYTYYNFSFGARAMGVSNAFTAVADDLTAVFWNPAGIAEFNAPEAYINYRNDDILYNYDLQEQAGSSIFNNRYTRRLDSRLKSLDFVSISVPAYFWDMKWNFALSYYKCIPYRMTGKLMENEDSYVDGISTGYNHTVQFAGTGGIDVLGFTAAYYLSEYFTLGITLQQFINTGTADYQSMYQNADASSKLADNETYIERLEGRNMIMGFIFKPMTDVAVGMTYRTRLANTFHSDYTDIYSHNGSTGMIEDSVQANVVLPPRLSLGIMARLFPFMRLSVDYFIIYWRLSHISHDHGQVEGEAWEFPVRNRYSVRQLNARNLRAGLEFMIPIQRVVLFLRGGLFKENPLFQAGAGNSKAIKLTGYSLGLGLDVSSVVAIDFAYMKQKANWGEKGYFDPATPVLTHYKNSMLRLSLIFRFSPIKKKTQF